MSRSNWVSNLAVGIAVALCISLAVGVAGIVRYASIDRVQTEVERNNGGRYSEPAKDADGSALPVGDPSSSQEYQPDCSKKEDADLCVQRRMADAGEDQALYTFIGLWLLLFTLVFTGWTANEARRAANAALKSVESLIDSERPIMQISDVQVACRPHEVVSRIGVRITFQNFGKTGCWMNGVGVTSYVGRITDARSRNLFREKFGCRIRFFVPPDGSFGKDVFTSVSIHLDRKQMDAILAEKASIVVYGFAQYSGMAGRTWTTRFGFYVCPGDGFSYAVQRPHPDPIFWLEECDGK